MMDAKQLKDFISYVLADLGEGSFYSRSIVYQMLFTVATESGFGRWIKQTNGPACGIYQIEPYTEKLVWKWCLQNNKVLFKALVNSSSGDVFGGTDLMGNLKYQTIVARANYYSWPVKLPVVNDPVTEKNIEDMAHYWKEYWNTYEGAGLVTEAIDKYKKYVHSRM